MEESVYPYKASEGQCRFNATSAKASTASWTQVPLEQCDQLLAATNISLVSVALDGSGIMFYKGGVFADKSCSNTLSHAVWLTAMTVTTVKTIG